MESIDLESTSTVVRQPQCTLALEFTSHFKECRLLLLDLRYTTLR